MHPFGAPLLERHSSSSTQARTHARTVPPRPAQPPRCSALPLSTLRTGACRSAARCTRAPRTQQPRAARRTRAGRPLRASMAGTAARRRRLLRCAGRLLCGRGGVRAWANDACMRGSRPYKGQRTRTRTHALHCRPSCGPLRSSTPCWTCTCGWPSGCPWPLCECRGVTELLCATCTSRTAPHWGGLAAPTTRPHRQRPPLRAVPHEGLPTTSCSSPKPVYSPHYSPHYHHRLPGPWRAQGPGRGARGARGGGRADHARARRARVRAQRRVWGERARGRRAPRGA